MDDKILLIKNLIEKKGYKFTNQKKMILEELFKVNTHLNSKQIYDKVKDKKIGLATVYRTLNLFSEIGIVKEINVDGVSYYELKMYGKKPLHIHFQCVKCNSVIDIDDNNLNLQYLKIGREIEDKNNVDIYDIDIMLVGVCDKCKKPTVKNQ
ncbi:Fur family transcriptional regulator [Tepidibacter formicigenes]|jgi:Fe2+ or Zn2+ uptake regulation protein|uniref:Fe2+ or Zn2+ uptake regulation protein n=1 Tax=Tepidibacter formicigenes DSM 15518 TaxID=1123349 RepID=A0A1M6S046_9FIRM|nr:transcriptional repressor [Tepidibacter formicigenes]SHK38081.1 Fe2+ or Zn2+ uptake regulation protein [Tepidibacter formicigenes DSM 15518]